MPPKAKISKKMVVDAGLKIVRTEGAGNLNVRRIASELNCSTQPVVYHYDTVNDLKSDVYDAADKFHEKFIMTPDENSHDPLLSIGLRYIRFAEEEKYLFRFLFQSDKFCNISFHDLLDVEGVNPVIQPLCEVAKLTESQAKEVFETLFVCVHGIASLIANNSLTYNEAQYEKLLTKTFLGTLCIIKGDKND